MKKVSYAIVASLIAILMFSSVAFAATPPGQKGNEGQPGNQGGYHQAGHQGYEGQPGNQGG
jgi:hypothetical protein